MFEIFMPIEIVTINLRGEKKQNNINHIYIYEFVVSKIVLLKYLNELSIEEDDLQ